jgi:signal transduction histidine kinase
MKLDQGPVSPSFATAGLVHDLGNLIQIASSALAILARTPDMPAVHSGPMLRRATDCLDHAGAIVRQSIGDMRNRSVSDWAANVTACLDDVAALVVSMGQPELGLQLDVTPGLPDVHCNSLALHSAVLNLVLNARDAMAGNGVVTIKARAIVRGQVATGIEISVADNGIGMSPSTMACAFDPFFTTKPDGLGGIGLPMVERFARESGGEIQIESELGAGTTVTLRLPASALVINGE